MQVGDYIRTKNGEIGKVVDRYEVNDYYKVVVDIRNGFIEKHKEHLFKKYIKVSSPNIIDLIEIGDYVNGHKISLIYNNVIYTDEYTFDNIEGEFDRISFKYDDIKTIVTKEQFKSMEYKVD